MDKLQIAKAKAVLRERDYTVVRRKLTSSYFHELHFSPRSIFDIGVNRGTPWLYDAYKDCHLILVDPREESLRETRDLFPNYNVSCFTCAAGAATGEVELQITPQVGRSSVHARTALTDTTVAERRSVPLKTLDEICLAARANPPFGVKIDTEGYEVEVIKGARKTLKDTEFVIAEISVKRRFVEGYRFSDMISVMSDAGFEVLDFLSYRRLPPAYVDCLFVRADSLRFSDRTPSTTWQRLARLLS